MKYFFPFIPLNLTSHQGERETRICPWSLFPALRPLPPFQKSPARNHKNLDRMG